MRKPRILVVEDDDLWLKRAVDNLEAEGFDVKSAASATAGHRILQSGEPIDLAVFDIHLNPDDQVQDRSGLLLAKQYPRVLRIIWTAQDRDGALLVDTMKEGIDVVLKSSGVRGLVEAVKAALGMRVFLIHGRDRHKDTVLWFLRSHGLKPIVLAEEATGSWTIIELLERYSGVDCAVAVLTPDDEGRLRDSGEPLQPRARQNVVFELGFFAAALGRDRLFVLCDPAVDRPSNYAGVNYIAFDGTNQWQPKLIQALTVAGVRLNPAQGARS